MTRRLRAPGLPRAAALALALLATGAAAVPPPSTAWRETKLPLEDRLFAAIPGLVRQVQRYNTRFFGEGLKRIFHPLPLIGMHAEFRVAEDLPPRARHGVFVPGARYRAMARFSRGLGIWTSDKVPDIWGVAVKLFDVPGTAILKDPTHGRVQDFTALNSVNFPAPNAAAVPKILKAAADYRKFAWRGPRSIRLRDYPMALRIFGGLIAKRVRTLASETYWSGAPIKMGPYAVKFRFRPTVKPPEARPEGSRWLRRDLARRVREGPVVFDFEVQYFRSEARTPIEENMVEWKPKHAPWEKLGELVIPRFTGSDAEFHARTQEVDRQYFHPWQVVEAHRPLGSVMRARRFAYSASQMNRGRPTADPLLEPGPVAPDS